MAETFDSIFKSNYDNLYTLAFRMTGNREESEDILQSSFLNAFKAFKNFRNESTAYTWLYRIVINTAKKYYHEERRLPVKNFAENEGLSEAEIYDYINQHGNTEDITLINLSKENCLQMFMNCMPSKYRAVFTLRIILKFSVKDTAEILGINENTVKVNLNRARAILKEETDGRCSLIQPGAMCNCRKYASYLSKNNKMDRLIEIETINQVEKRAVQEFENEIKDIFQIENHYNTRIKSVDYEFFKERVKRLSSLKTHKILKY